MEERKDNINLIFFDYMHTPTITLSPKAKKEDKMLRGLFTPEEITKKRDLQNEKKFRALAEILKGRENE